MINVSDVVADPDFQPPQPFTVQRSSGQWILGGFQSITTNLVMFGPVQQASNKEIQMLPEADRVGEIRSFWSLVPIYVTRGYGTVSSVHSLVVQGIGGQNQFTLVQTPPGDYATIIKNGVMLMPGVDYALVGMAVTLTVVAAQNDVFAVIWPAQLTGGSEAAASDVLVYETQQYRVLSVYYDPGGGYWKALGTRTAAA